jgi:hypothetical protein
MDQLEEQMRPADSNTTFLVIAWLWVGIPLAWGGCDHDSECGESFSLGADSARFDDGVPTAVHNKYGCCVKSEFSASLLADVEPGNFAVGI